MTNLCDMMTYAQIVEQSIKQLVEDLRERVVHDYDTVPVSQAIVKPLVDGETVLPRARRKHIGKED